MESGTNEVGSQHVNISRDNPIRNSNGEIRGSDIYPFTQSERLVHRRRGRPATRISRGRGSGVARGLRLNAHVEEIGRADEEGDLNDDQFSDNDDEEFDVDLENVEEHDNSEESEDATRNNNDDNFESDDSVLSDVGSDDEADIYPSDEYDEDRAIHGSRKRKYKDLFKGVYDKPFVDPGNGNIKFEIGQVFDDVHSFRTALRDYAVHGGFRIKRMKNDAVRVTATCEDKDCTWRIRAARLQDKVTFMVKKLSGEHKCFRRANNTNPNGRTKWIGSKLKTLLEKDPNCTYETMEATLSEVWDFEAPHWQLYRARNMARDGVNGTHAESYMHLNKWIIDIKRSNPGTCIKFEYQPRENLDDAPQFKRIFICYEGMKKGFLAGCRPFIGLDGCHLKGPFGGVLLAALAIDANRGIFPLAMGIVEVECNSSWGFFLESLKSCIDMGSEDIPYTFISDRQKGIVDAVAEIFPSANHRNCARHLWMNFKLQHASSNFMAGFGRARGTRGGSNRVRGTRGGSRRARGTRGGSTLG